MNTHTGGSIEAVYIAGQAAAPMQPMDEVQAVAGSGLAGDRYADGNGTFSQSTYSDTHKHVTLIEAEAIEAVARDYEIDLTPAATRRNIVTRGVALNHLVGREFSVGEGVRLRGIRLCEPCGHVEKLADRSGLRKALIHRGGLRCEILQGGTIRVGDAITTSNNSD